MSSSHIRNEPPLDKLVKAFRVRVAPYGPRADYVERGIGFGPSRITLGIAVEGSPAGCRRRDQRNTPEWLARVPQARHQVDQV